MDGPFWLFNDDNDEESSYIFEIIGKALMICTRFECYCKNIELHLEIKRTAAADDDVLNETFLNALSNEIYKKILNKNIRAFPFEGELKDLLIDAKNMRNVIVHVTTKGLDEPECSPGAKETLKADLKNMVEKILYAEYVLVITLAIITKEPVPNENYIAKNLNWIFYKDSP